MKTEYDCIDAIKKQWEELGKDLNEGQIKYDDDIENLKKTSFFHWFDDMFINSKENAVTQLSEIDLLIRACCSKNKPTKDRFIAIKEKDGEKWEKYKDKLKINRFNEPKRGFMYLGISMKNDKKTFRDVENTCLKEIRKFDEDNKDDVYVLEFKVPNDKKNLKVLDFSKINRYNSCDEILKEYTDKINLLNKEYIEIRDNLRKSGAISKESTRRAKKIKSDKSKIEYELCVKMCLKIVNDATFKPVNKKISEEEYDQKLKVEYAPFHCFANYIEKRGYSGIIYNSTVDKDNKGLNLVLFERYDVEPYGSVKSHDSL